MAPLPRPLRLLTHLAVSCGLMALWLPPQTVPPLFVALALVLLWPALALPQPVPWRGWRLSWDVITAFVLVPAVALWLAAPAHGMTALTVLIVVMELRWAHNPGSARQTRLMLALAALMLALVGRVTESPWFLAVAGPFFVTALGALVWSESLLASTLANPQSVGPPPRVLEGWTRWTTPLRLALVAMALGGAIFLLFPRTGRTTAREALAGAGTESAIALTGMTNQVMLGAYSQLLEDPSPALRVTWDDGPPPGPIYLRGAAHSVLQRVGGVHWRWSPVSSSAEITCAAREITPLVPREIPSSAILQRVEAINPFLRTIYAAPHLVAVRGPGGTLLRAGGEHWRAPDVEQRWPVYEAFSVPGGWPASMTSPQEITSSLDLPRTLRLPLERFLATHQIVSPHDAPEQQAQSILHHLRRTHRHSLDLTAIRGPDPLLDFTLHGRPGNCEFFASAMAVLCRAAGIPARLVTGFHGGEPQDDGSRLFRSLDAHAWVEVWVDGRGWTLMDPTPADPLVAQPNLALWQGVAGLLGQVSGRWHAWVVDYEGAWHRRFLRWSGERADHFVAAVSGEAGLFQKFVTKFKHNLREEPRLWLFIAAVLALNLLALGLDRRIRRHGWPWRHHPRHRRTPHELLVEQLARALVPQPRPRRPDETASEYLEKVASGGSLPRDPVRELVASYYAWRFSPDPGRLSASLLLAQAARVRQPTLQSPRA